MTAQGTATAPASQVTPAPPRRRRHGPMYWLRKNALRIYAVLAFVYIFTPIAYVTVFSFNKPKGRFNYEWQHFSTDAWRDPCGVAGMCGSLSLSLRRPASTLSASTVNAMPARKISPEKTWMTPIIRCAVVV